jgi:hypothetical protein
MVMIMQSDFKKGVLTGVLVTGIACLLVDIIALSGYFLVEKSFSFSGRTIRSVNSERGWQSTHIRIYPGDQVDITVVDGKWTHWKGTQAYTSGAGGGYVCGKAMNPLDCVEPLPEFFTGGLIGRVGKDVFAIGIGTRWKSTEIGELELRINDGDVGLDDNNGVLKVEITLGK